MTVIVSSQIITVGGIQIFQYTATSASFGGSSEYLLFSSPLTGGSDTSLNTTSFWFKVDDADGDGDLMVFMESSTGSYSVVRNASDEIEITLKNSGGTTLWNFTSTDTFNSTTNTGWHILQFSVDLDGSPTADVYLDNEVLAGTDVTGPITGTIDYTTPEWSIGATETGTNKLTGELSEFWMDNTLLDFTVDSNRLKFLATVGDAIVPKELGNNGEKPTGTIPLLYFTGGIDSWHTNKGSGGGFTEFGVLTVGSTVTIDVVVLATTCDLSKLDYDGVTLSLSAVDSSPRVIAFRNDGTRMFMLGAANDSVFQYTLPTPWSLTGASYSGVSVNAISGFAEGLKFNNNGTRMYTTETIGSPGSANVHEYALSTAWDLSTAVDSSSPLNVFPLISSPNDIAFNTAGTKLFIASSDRKIYQYTLSVAFDVSTGTYDSVFFDTSTQTSCLQSITWCSPTILFVADFCNAALYQYDLTVNYDLSTASYSGNSYDVSGEDDGPVGIASKPDGTALFVSTVFTANAVFQYSYTL